MTETERELDLQLADATEEIKELQRQLEIAKVFIDALSEEVVTLRSTK